jgi:DNA-binding transcriptional ArsR family regulator
MTVLVVKDEGTYKVYDLAIIMYMIVAKGFYTQLNSCLVSESPMKAFIVIREPEAFQLLADETRRKILYLLRVKDMNVNQLAAELGLTSQAVYHHIRKLLKGKMVEVTKEERVGHLIESYYRATAEDFLLSTGKIKAESVRDKAMVKEQITAVLKAYRKFGLDVKYDDSNISKLVDLWVGLQEDCGTCMNPELQDKIWSSDDISLLEKTMAAELSSVLLMTDEEFARNEKNRRELRTFLRSLSQKKEKIIPAKLA